ncbi:protein LYRIC-like isoform X2 [Narcine bancroftii]|uniref:protein LYRIC-like isoform X2 n=1 Tax=Narcine bancroftii TaxID=1343680 RepID=UPI0038319DA7
MLEPLSRWLQVPWRRGRELLSGGGLSDPTLFALSLLLGAVLLLLVLARGRGHHAAAGRALPADEHLLLLEAPAASWKKPRQHEEPKKKRRKEKWKEPVNGHPPFSNDMQLLSLEETKDSQATEKKALKAKKKKQRLDERPKDQSVSGKREKNEEESGDWVTKISNREKRQLRKERQKKKCDVTGFVDPNVPLHSDGSRTLSRTVKDYKGSDDQEESIVWNAPPDSLGDTSSSWKEATDKASVWHFTGGGATSSIRWGPSDKPMATSGWGVATKDLGTIRADWETADSIEQDIFSNIVTQDNPSQESPTRCHLSASLPSHVIDEAWLGIDDPFAVDLNSDWSPPTEEWGNWTGEEIFIAQEVEKGKMKLSEEEEEKSQVNPASSSRSKRKKRKKKGKNVEDSVGSEVLRDCSQKKILADVDLKGMSQRSEIEMEQCSTEIAVTEQWNSGASTSCNEKNGFALDCAKTEKKKMKARRET